MPISRWNATSAFVQPSSAARAASGTSSSWSGAPAATVALAPSQACRSATSCALVAAYAAYGNAGQWCAPSGERSLTSAFARSVRDLRPMPASGSLVMFP